MTLLMCYSVYRMSGDKLSMEGPADQCCLHRILAKPKKSHSKVKETHWAQKRKCGNRLCTGCRVLKEESQPLIDRSRTSYGELKTGDHLLERINLTKPQSTLAISLSVISINQGVVK